MNAPHLQEHSQEERTWREVVFESWFAIGSLLIYLIILIEEWFAHGHIGHTAEVWVGLPVLSAMVLGMNGLSRTDMIAREHPDWWLNHSHVRWAHLISNEGELAGIGLSVIIIGAWQAFSGHVIDGDHIAFGMAFTLFGIMSGAALVQNFLAPVLANIEILTDKVGLGRAAALFVGSMAASGVGEPGAAQILGNYTVDRVNKPSRKRMGGVLALTIGAGGSMLWFAAPPILIVQRPLEGAGWGLMNLIGMVGLPSMLMVAAASIFGARFMEPLEKATGMKKINWPPVIAFMLLVVLHIPAPVGFLPLELLPAVFALDVLIGAMNIFVQWTHLDESDHELDEHGFQKIFQPAVLAVLLICLEMVGHISQPFIKEMSGMAIEAGLSGFPLIIGLFLLTAGVSAVADNALASVVIITIPLTGMAGNEQAIGAAAVLMGALYGGVLLPPSNLPNFAIKAILGIPDSKEWLAGSVRVLPFGVFYIATLALFYYKQSWFVAIFP